MYCSKCGNELPKNAEFCNKCGVKIEVAQTSSTTEKTNNNPVNTQTNNVNFDDANYIMGIIGIVSLIAGIFILGIVFGLISIILGTIVRERTVRGENESVWKSSNKARNYAMICLIGGVFEVFITWVTILVNVGL